MYLDTNAFTIEHNPFSSYNTPQSSSDEKKESWSFSFNELALSMNDP